MKESNYNLFIEDSGKVLCYNSYSDSYMMISNNSYVAMKNYGLSKMRELYPNTYEKMVLNGFLIDDSTDELAIIRTQNKREAFASEIYYLMIYPTQDCNLKCWYCYESHVPHSKMSEDTLASVKLHITNICQSGKFKRLRITFFGGEPLLYFHSIVLPLLVHGLNETQCKGMEFTPFFVTNASLLKNSVIDAMIVYKPLFQITLDGDREKHDKVRIWKNKQEKGTYLQIINALHAISTKCNYKHANVSNVATIRINYDNYTLDDIVEILNDLEDLDKPKFFIHLERVWQTSGLSSSNDQFMKLKKALMLINQAGFNVGFGIFGNKRVSCPAEIEYYAIINWDGNIYKCNGRTLMQKDRVGVLSNTGDIIWDENKQAQRIGRATFENAMCINCKMLPKCMGPCSQKQIELSQENLKKGCSLSSIDMTLDDYLRINFELLLSNRQ